MKILLYSAQWPEYMIELANAMAELEEVYLMQPTNHRFTTRHKELISGKVRFIPYSNIPHQSRRYGIPLAIKILYEVWRIRPDILHVQANGGYPMHWVVKLLPKKTKVVNTIHDPQTHLGDTPSLRAYNKQVVEGVYAHTHKFIVHGEYLKFELSKISNIPIDKISVIPHGHFGIYKKFAKQPLPDTDPNALMFFGRRWRYKGLQVFINAANLVAEKLPQARFYIVGTGEPLSNYNFDERYRDQFIIIDKRVSMEEAAYYYSLVSFIVLPYLEATQSGVIPVAYAFKKPVIATPVGSIPEVVVDGITGILVPKEDEISLANQMKYLLEQPEMAERLGEQALAFAYNQLSWSLIAERTLNCYKEICVK
jgi:alpha-maltose-1-phosphate synthase